MRRCFLKLLNTIKPVTGQEQQKGFDTKAVTNRLYVNTFIRYISNTTIHIYLIIIILNIF